MLLDSAAVFAASGWGARPAERAVTANVSPRHFPHIPRAERVREADALAGVQIVNTRIGSRLRRSQTAKVVDLSKSVCYYPRAASHEIHTDNLIRLTGGEMVW